MSADKVYTLAERREMLEDAERRLQECKKAKKRDTAVHNENIAAVEQEIKDILKAIDDDTK